MAKKILSSGIEYFQQEITAIFRAGATISADRSVGSLSKTTMRHPKRPIAVVRRVGNYLTQPEAETITKPSSVCRQVNVTHARPPDGSPVDKLKITSMREGCCIAHMYAQDEMTCFIVLS